MKTVSVREGKGEGEQSVAYKNVFSSGSSFSSFLVLLRLLLLLLLLLSQGIGGWVSVYLSMSFLVSIAFWFLGVDNSVLVTADLQGIVLGRIRLTYPQPRHFLKSSLK